MFKKFIESFSSSKNQVMLIGITEADGAKCPYCQTPLSKFPKKKISCHKCKNEIYVLKRPTDGLHVLLTKKEHRRLKDEITFMKDKQLKKRYEETCETLKKEFSSEPNHFDVMWRILNEDIITTSKQNETCRGIHVDMVERCFDEENYKVALGICITMLVEDMLLLFPSKRNYDKKTFESISKINKDLLNPQLTSLSGGIVSYYKECISHLKLKSNDIKELLVNELNAQSKRLWIKPDSENIWEYFELHTN